MSRHSSRPSSGLELVLRPLSWLYALAVVVRNRLFDWQWLASSEIERPMVSIGNLTAGGTGKTPLTALLIEGMIARGKQPAVISRGYGGREPGPVQVPAQGADPDRYGDEPSWLAQRFPSVPVVIGRDRTGAARWLIKNSSLAVDLIFADDAFQHRRMKRHLDLVVIDATEPDWHYRWLPLGRLRESLSGLGRADVLVFTKTNLVSVARMTELRKQIRAQLRARAPMVSWFELESHLKTLSPLNQSELEVSLDRLQGKKVVLLSGIGRPETFDKLVCDDIGARVERHFAFKDHHRFEESELVAVVTQAKDCGAEAIVVTEKDAVKLVDWKPDLPVWVARLKFQTSPQSPCSLEDLYEEIVRISC